VTLVLTVNGPETIWALADRRLSYERQPPKDDARKIMCLETVDGVGFITYAGLGITALRTEPSDWVSAVLRGRNLTFEQSLVALAEAAKNQLPRHVVQLPVPGHTFVVPAFVGREPRLYTIDLVFAPDRTRSRFDLTRHVAKAGKTPRVGLAGTGGDYLRQDHKWLRDLLRVVRANDRGQLPAMAVADHLARLNMDVHRDNKKSVGPSCIVAWRPRRGSVHTSGGGAQFYTGTTREGIPSCLPTIGSGMDVRVLMEAGMRHAMARFEAIRAGQPEPSDDGLREDVARFPHEPDEDLR